MTLQEARALLAQVGVEARALIDAQYTLLNREVLPALERAGVSLVRRTEFTAAQRAWVAQYFEREVRPLLTPIGLDPAHPFPQVVNKSLNFVIELSGTDAFGRETAIAIVKAPRVLPRVIRLPADVGGGDNAFVMLSSVIHAHLHELFPGRAVVNYAQFRVTRDADLWIDEEEVKNLRQALQGELPQRQFGSAVRLEVAANCPDPLAQFLLQQFELTDADLYRCDGPVNIARLTSLVDQVDIDALKYPPFIPGIPDRLREQPDILAAIRQHDILLHHPYQSFEPVVDFIRKAADDPDVVAVKQTVYRTGVNSVLMEALIEAARRGKEVTVVVELMARFDEEANINWAERLEHAGAQVVYGVFGLKTHAKLALLIRREPDARGRMRLRPYAHLGTGNYHPRTTQLYSDFGLLTADAGDLRRRERRLHAHHEPREGGADAASAARAVHDASPRDRDDPARDGARARRPAGAHRRQDERAARGGRHPRALRRVAGGRRDRPHRARRVRAAAWRARAVRPHSRALDPGPLPRAPSHLVSSPTRARPTCGCRPPTGWAATCSAGSRSRSRSATSRLRKRVVEEGLSAYLADTRDAWELHARRHVAQDRVAPRKRMRSAQRELLAAMREPEDGD